MEEIKTLEHCSKILNSVGIYYDSDMFDEAEAILKLKNRILELEKQLENTLEKKG